MIGADSEDPDDEARAAILRGIDVTYPCLRTIRVVLLGSGLRITIIRSGLVAMTLIAGLRGQPFHVDRTLEHTAQEYERQLGRPAREFLDKLVAKGIVSPDEL